MKNRIAFTLLLIPFLVNAQVIGFEDIDPASVSSWITQNAEDYEGVYHFGDSEVESNLLVVIEGNIVTAQIQYGEFSPDGRAWNRHFVTLSPVKLQGFLIILGTYAGEFVLYDNGTAKVPGLRVVDPWIMNLPKGKWEVGLRNDVELKSFYSGKFPEASFTLVTEEGLSKYSKADLQIMRNEIFARYGYKFRKGGKMEAYFQKQKWYVPEFENVDDFMTEIELMNIKTIQAVERK